jgi:hypothetical protein
MNQRGGGPLSSATSKPDTFPKGSRGWNAGFVAALSLTRCRVALMQNPRPGVGRSE